MPPSNSAQYKNIALIYSSCQSAIEIATHLKSLYKFSLPHEANLILVIGGDGQLLHSLHQYMHLNIPFYGINAGSIGFLMNVVGTVLHFNDFYERLLNSRPTTLHPLQMKAISTEGKIHKALAINEVSIFRQTNQAAKIQITVNDATRMQELIADGILVATPAGSSAYNLSAGGSIVPLEANILCLTSICSFRPRRWQGALLPANATIKLDILESTKRPVNAVADFYEFKNITSVSIKSHTKKKIRLLFDQNHSLEDRIIKEQFLESI